MECCGLGLAHRICGSLPARPFATCVGGPGVYRAYECWARRARTVCRGGGDRWCHGELFQTRLTPAHDHIRSWIAGLPGPVAVTYEADPTGFGLYRSLTAAGIRGEVAAPSKLAYTKAPNCALVTAVASMR